jgi:hypothetical protein
LLYTGSQEAARRAEGS